MAAIMVTGNYNFFNLHYMLLCVAMLEIGKFSLIAIFHNKCFKERINVNFEIFYS